MYSNLPGCCTCTGYVTALVSSPSSLRPKHLPTTHPLVFNLRFFPFSPLKLPAAPAIPFFLLSVTRCVLLEWISRVPRSQVHRGPNPLCSKSFWPSVGENPTCEKLSPLLQPQHPLFVFSPGRTVNLTSPIFPSMTFSCLRPMRRKPCLFPSCPQ